MYNSNRNHVGTTKLAESAEKNTKFIDPGSDLEYLQQVGRLASGEPDSKRRGIIGISDAQNMWDSTQKNWASGDYPKTSHVTPGAAAVPFKGFSSILSDLPATVQRSEVDETHPAITGKRVVFGGIKNFDSGRHHNIHLYYEADGPDSFRLKASTHTSSKPKTTANDGEKVVDHSTTNLHGDHVYDVASGVWHPRGESHQGPNATTSYNPIDVIQSAPEDYADTTTRWKLPSPALAFCKSCKRFPKHLDKMLSIMRTDKCTTCGTTGVSADYAWQPSAFAEGIDTGVNGVTHVCGNSKCENYKNSVVANPAYIDSDYNIVYPGEVGTQERRVYQFTPATHKAATEELQHRKTVLGPELADQMKEALKLGDLSESGDFQAADAAMSENDLRMQELTHQLTPGRHEIVDSLPEGFEGTSVAPHRTVYENNEFAKKIAEGDLRKVSPTAMEVHCDHKDCSCAGESIPTHIDSFPRNDLPCSHCGRSEANGVSIATTPDGYSRCNPVEYGANNCAPVPADVSDTGAYLQNFQPDPENKFPTVKADAKSGAGVIFQRDEDEQDRNNSAGLYPGTQKMRTRNLMTMSQLVGHGIEKVKNAFSYGVTRPWPFLGMEGRGIAKPDSSKEKNKATLGDEAVTPASYKAATRTPILGDVKENDINVDDFLPDATVAIDKKYEVPSSGKLAVDSEGNTLHPDLTQKEWNEYLGYNPHGVVRRNGIMRRILDAMAKNPTQNPISLEDDGSRRVSNKLASYEDDAPLTSEVLQNTIKSEQIPDPKAEGIDPSDEAALDSAREIAAEQRSKDVQSGYVLNTTPTERLSEELQEVGPTVFYRDRGNSKNLSQKAKDSLKLDMQNLVKEAPGPGGAQFDDPELVAEQQELWNEAPGLEPEEDELAVTRSVPSSYQVETKHDVEHCNKCDKNGIIRPEVAGPEKIKKLNQAIGEGTAIIKRNEKDATKRRALISDLTVRAYTCDGN